MKELTWQAILQTQQQDFIQRLKYDLAFEPRTADDITNINLICLNYHPIYNPSSYPSEQVNISFVEPDEEDIDYFCCELVKKFSYTVEKEEYPVDAYMNNKIGKVGEEAVKIYLDDLITGVNYELYEGGDTGTDFFIKDNKNIGIQVKTKCLNRIKLVEVNRKKLCEEDVHNYSIELGKTQAKRVEEIIWNINNKEIEQNKAIICVLLINSIEVDQVGSSYYCIMAGFKPTAEIRNHDLTIHDLYYIGGIRPFLESLK